MPGLVWPAGDAASVIAPCYELDLHQLSGPVLPVALWASLAELMKGGRKREGGEEASPGLVIVTGYKGRRAAVRDSVVEVRRREPRRHACPAAPPRAHPHPS